MPSITIKYFDIKGRAEPIRLCLAIGGIPFEDVRLTKEEFGKLKNDTTELPFGQVPIMTIDGKTVSQSGAILRYCGKLAGLYPKDDMMKAARVDEMLGAIDDLSMSMFSYRGKDRDLLKEARKNFVEKDVVKFVNGLDRIYGSEDRRFLCGDDMTIADLSLYYTVWNAKSGYVDFVDTNLFDKYPKIIRSYKGVLEHPKVTEWNKKTEKKSA